MVLWLVRKLRSDVVTIHAIDKRTAADHKNNAAKTLLRHTNDGWFEKNLYHMATTRNFLFCNRFYIIFII